MAGINVTAGRGAPRWLQNVTGVTTGILNGLLAHAVLNPGFREFSYQGNHTLPNVVPDAESIIKLFYTGDLGPLGTKTLLTYLGIDWQIALNNGTLQQQAWNAIITNSKPLLPIGDALQLWRNERLHDDDLKEVLRRAGFVTQGEQDWWKLQSDPMPLELVLLRYRLGLATLAATRKHLAQLGYVEPKWQDHIIQTTDVPSMSEIIAYSIRQHGSVADYPKWTAANGILDPTVLRVYDELAKVIPGVQQLIQMGMRNVWDENLAARLQTDAELDDTTRYWLNSTGYGWQIGLDRIPGVQQVPQTFTNYLWRAHWTQLTPGQAYEMFHRLRPTGGPNNGPRIAGVAPFLQADVDAALRVNGYPPGLRKQLTAVSYRTMPIRAVRMMFQSGIIGQQETSEIYQDNGYRKEDGDRIAAMLQHQLTQSSVSKLNVANKQYVLNAYKLGIMSADEAKIALQIVYLEDFQRIADYRAMGIGQQLQQAAANPWVQLAINHADIEIQTEQVKAQVNAIKQGFLRLQLSAAQATDALIAAGIVQARAETYVQRWVVLLYGRGREASAAQIVSWYQQGLITALVAGVRLGRLGYTNTDIVLMLGAANIKIGEQVAKAQTAAAKQTAANKRALIAQIKAAQAQQKQMQAALAKSATKSQILKWVGLDLISVVAAYKRLLSLGTTGPDAILFLEQTVQSAQKKADTAKLKADTKNGTQSTNGTTTTAAPSGNGSAAGPPNSGSVLPVGQVQVQQQGVTTSNTAGSVTT